MSLNLNQILYKKFGHSHFREGQKESIESALAGQDTLVILPTGSGKSICYQLFPYIQPGTTLVISPLISLMQDQVDKIRLSGEKAVCSINSSLSQAERTYIFNHLNDYRFIFLSPEMLNQEAMIKKLKAIDINLLVVDEAHCVTQWGMDFRPDYLEIADFRKAINHPPIMALTATATKQVQAEIKSLLGFNPKTSETIAKPVDRPELKYVFERVEDKNGRLLELVQTIQKPGIIYFSSKKQADQVAQLLTREGIQVESYHSDKSSLDKIIIQNQFLSNQLQVICATSAFGMGVDKKDIRFVIHYHLPADPEMYLQEVGRCSRDGKDGLALTLYKDGDEQLQEFLKLESLPEPSTIQYVYRNNQDVRFKDDSQYKIINYFYKKGQSIESTVQFFNERRQFLKNQIAFMKDLTFTDQCKRRIILNYFDEEPLSQTDLCCNSCHENILNHFQLDESQQAPEIQVKSPKKILQSLYNRM